VKPGLRRRLTLLVTVVALVTVGALTAGVNLALRSSLDQDASKLLQARAEAAAESVDVVNGQIRIDDGSKEPAPDAQVWVFDGTQMVDRPQTATSAEDALATQLVRSGAAELDDDASDVRLGAVPISDTGGTRVGTLVTAISLEPYERTEERALLISILFAILVVTAMSAATWIVVGRALRPVAEMTADVANWSAHDIDRRFRVGEPSDELTRLAATFDGLLDRVAAVLRHEKRFSAELSHELRTPLAAVAAEAELALRRERTPGEYRAALAQISRKAHELTEIVETLLLAAREETSPQTATTDLRQPVAAAVDGVRELAGRCHVAIDTELPAAPMISAIEATSVRRLLAPVLENACAYARSSVTVSLSAGDAQAVIAVADDGPGLAAADDEATVFEPGKRGKAERNPAAPEGTGLGLSLARRLARALGGEIVSVSQPAGARFEIRLPLSG
jgi:two-component system, OmpR family, sensor kinase